MCRPQLLEIDEAVCGVVGEDEAVCGVVGEDELYVFIERCKLWEALDKIYKAKELTSDLEWVD